MSSQRKSSSSRSFHPGLSPLSSLAGTWSHSSLRTPSDQAPQSLLFYGYDGKRYFYQKSWKDPLPEVLVQPTKSRPSKIDDSLVYKMNRNYAPLPDLDPVSPSRHEFSRRNYDDTRNSPNHSPKRTAYVPPSPHSRLYPHRAYT